MKIKHPMPENARNVLSLYLNWAQFSTLLNALFSFPAAFSTNFRSSAFELTRNRFINSFNQTIALTIPILTNFLQLKNNSPFSTHPKTMCVSVSTTLIFYLAFTALLRFPLRRRFAMIADHFLLSIGNASIATLASVLLPDSFSPFVFALFGILSAAESVYWLYDALVTEDDRRMSVFLDNVWTAFSNFTGRRQPILPV